MDLPVFVQKTYELVDAPWNNNIISWSANGRSIIIWDTWALEQEVLSKYFNHNNYSSFVRQLNLYGFSKIANSFAHSKTAEFHHPHFVRGDPAQLAFIVRNTGGKKQVESPTPPPLVPTNVTHPVQYEMPPTDFEIQQLQEEIYGIEKESKKLKDELEISKAQLSKAIESDPRFADVINTFLPNKS